MHRTAQQTAERVTAPAVRHHHNEIERETQTAEGLDRQIAGRPARRASDPGGRWLTGLRQSQGAVEGDPAADLGDGVRLDVAELTQAGVGRPPQVADAVGQGGDHGAVGGVEAAAVADVAPHGVEEVPEAAELGLPRGGVADAHRRRGLVAGASAPRMSAGATSPSRA